jgi:hypothetical protein
MTLSGHRSRLLLTQLQAVSKHAEIAYCGYAAEV